MGRTMRSVAILGAAAMAAGAAGAMPPPAGLDSDLQARFAATSWAPKGSECAAGAEIVDFAPDARGFWHERRRAADQSAWSFVSIQPAASGSDFAYDDATGIGRTRQTWRIMPDGTLRLWSSVYFGEDERGRPTAGEDLVKDGVRALDDQGEPNPTPTPAYQPCPSKLTPIAADAAKALDGSWGPATARGICPTGEMGLRLALTGYVPTLEFARIGADSMSYGEDEGSYYVFDAGFDGAAATLTYGGAFDASELRIERAKDGTIRFKRYDGGDFVTMARCP